MNNFDKMKQALIEQINGMTVDEYYDFISVPEEQNDFKPGFVSEKAIFSCKECRNKFGDCHEYDDKSEICLARYREYALMEDG